MDNRPFSQAAENNKRPIAGVLEEYIQENQLILEIGSGTGQHIDYFSTIFPDSNWQPSDVMQNKALSELSTSTQTDLRKSLVLDVSHKQDWPLDKYDVVYTANTAHIMSWPEVLLMIELVGSVLKPKGMFICYGPFKFKGLFTSESNQIFDDTLKQKKASMGLRDFEEIEAEALIKQLHLVKVHDMPANNHILVFQRA